MTAEQCKILLENEVFEAFSRLETIQYRQESTIPLNWIDINPNPKTIVLFRPGYEYRVKPKLREYWLCVSTNDPSFVYGAYNSLDAAKMSISSTQRIHITIFHVEVISTQEG